MVFICTVKMSITTAAVKIVAWLLLLVSINDSHSDPPKLPHIKISLPQSSPFSFLLSLFYSPPSSPSDECKPDLSWFQDVNVSDVPVAFETCVEQVSELPQKTHPDMDKGTDEIIQSYGYPLENHKVTTEDGYILTLHRIPKPGKLPIYLQHGLGGCSDNWLFQYGNRSLAFLLADYGYDVWLANSRGTTYSLEHLTLQWDNPFNYSYWDFSWHEIGKYDVPAITDHIISVTGYSKIVYIGHSMGTTTYLVGLDQVPELNNKIVAGILLAPTGFLGRSPSPLRGIAELVGPDPFYLEPVLKGRVDFRHKDQLLQLLNLTTFADFCTPTAIRCTACDEIIFALYGMDAPQTNYTNIPNILSKFPNIMSVKTASHYAQSIIYCSFRQFDYGVEKNWLIYNSSVPPDYTLKNITVPIYSFYGEFDNLCRPKDVQRTLDLLPRETLKENIKVNFTLFNHVDFMLAEDAITLVYDKILRILVDISI